MPSETTGGLPPSLPPGLPVRGVLVLQKYPRLIVSEEVPRTARRKFLMNMWTVYSDRHARLVDMEYRDKAGQSLTECDDLMQRIRENVLHHAVLVHLIVWGRPDDVQLRLHELERQLVRLLTEDGIVVSLIIATGPMTAHAQLYRPSPNGIPLIERVNIDLTRFQR
jgi:hypothetical protein